MCSLVKFFTKACLYAGVFLVAVSCKDTDEFFSSNVDNGKGNEPVTRANTFDFSTTQKVDLQVDYSAFETRGPVRFSIYTYDPFVKGTLENPYWLDEKAEPVFTDFTGKDGKYDATITLPAYAKTLYIVTGDIFVSEKRMLTEVKNGKARVVANNTTRAAAPRPFTRALGEGTQTNDISTLWNLSYKVNTAAKEGQPSTWTNSGVRIYKDWATPLGTWNSASGYPSYLLPNTPENIAKGLVFSESELNGLYTAAKAALNSTQTCAEQYREQVDMTLQRESEVSITMLGGNTCWTSSLGYYYYTEETKPTSTLDLNIIMLLPNTMNGLWIDDKKCDYVGNIGIHDGDAVQLMYYPNIANGDYSGATTKFPRGTKIGFVLKTNGWGMQGEEYCVDNSATGWSTVRPYNNWAASTDGLSYWDKPSNGKYSNTTGLSRTAKFGYTAQDGTGYAIVSFEDACNDLNYSDVIFSLNPASAFTAVPEVSNGKTSTVGVFAFEDMWPAKGDYDMNDVVVNVKNELNLNSSGKVTKQVFYMTTYRKTVELINGLAARLITRATPSQVTMKKMAPKVADISKAENATYSSYKDTNTGFNAYYLTDYIESELGSTYVLELSYSTAQAVTNVADIEPFLFRRDSVGDKQLEVHIPRTKAKSGVDCMGVHTSKMNTSYFGTVNDKSNPSANLFFVREGRYPFAFYLSGTKAESFFDTILSGGSGSPAIDDFYPTFIPWSESEGSQYEDWYLNPRENR